jgi:hypothetical protein
VELASESGRWVAEGTSDDGAADVVLGFGGGICFAREEASS